MSFLKPLFANKLVEDDREPVMTFELPWTEDESYGLLIPKLDFWNQLVYVSTHTSLA